ncbi:MAG: tryptophan synthase subunit alpha [Planctomycetota bacterium]
MPRIDDIFTQRLSQNRKLLMPFICGGHPRPGMTSQLLSAMDRAGSAIVEVGIPFSDPIADGPVIAAAMHEALVAGSTPKSVFDEVASVRGSLECGLIAMVSVSIAYRWSGGPAGFVKDAAAAGFDGFIFPDAPLEESREFIEAAAKEGKTASLLVSPTTPPERAAKIAEASTGFVYLVARVGITGERDKAPDVSAPVARLRQVTKLPIACGFGISNGEQVRAVVKHADAAIVGSAVVRRISEAPKNGQDPVVVAESFVRSLVGGLVG